MDVGRWYKDNSGEEFRYIGSTNDDESIGLFSDGEKTFKKSLSDFENVPKEKKLFGFFKKGGITANDLLEARSFFGEAEWKKLKRQDRINSARYLKRTGKIGYKKGGKLPEPEESQEYYASMQYADGGDIGEAKARRQILRDRNRLVQMNVGKDDKSLNFAIKLIDMLLDDELPDIDDKEGEAKARRQILRDRNRLVQMNVGKNDKSLNFAIKLIDMLLDGELYDKGGEISSIKKGISFYKRKAKKGNRNAKINLELLQGILERKQNPIVRTQFEEEEFEYKDGGMIDEMVASLRKKKEDLKEQYKNAQMDGINTDKLLVKIQKVNNELNSALKQMFSSIKLSDGGELDEEDSLDYNSISDLQTERNRLVRWSNQYGSKGADYKIKQLEKRIDYLKSKDSKMADGGMMGKYIINVYYGGEMEDEVFYTDNLFEAKKISQKGEHSEIYDNSKKEFIEYAKGGEILDLQDVYNELRSKVGRLEINEETKDNISCDIRDWGNWEHDYEDYDRDEEDFEDDDSMILSRESSMRMSNIVKEVRAKYPSASISWNTSEKNYIDFQISRKMAKGGKVDYYGDIDVEARKIYNPIGVNSDEEKEVSAFKRGFIWGKSQKKYDRDLAEDEGIKEYKPIGFRNVDRKQAVAFWEGARFAHSQKGKKMAKGGKVTFQDKANAIADSLEGKKVAPKYRKQYGAKYDRSEAEMAGKRIAGAMRKKYGI